MIKLAKLQIKNFRGIVELDVDFGAKNFAICGPNGTGKSGIVDAIEFVITGDIARLSGRGTQELSVKQHGPHVDKRNDPAACRIIATLLNLNTGSQFTLERSIADPKAPIITPENSHNVSVVEQLSVHPELALSRREIIKYILTPAGDRAKEVQTLLRLDALEKFRKSLVTINNALTSEQRSAAHQLESAEKNLRIALKTDNLHNDSILNAVNSRRQDARLDQLKGIAPGAIKRDLHDAGSSKSLVPREIALREVADVLAPGQAPKSSRSLALGLLKNLQDDSALLTNLRRAQFFRQGLDFADDNYCPLCDIEWVLSDLKAHLEQKLESVQKADSLLSELRSHLQNIADAITTRESLLRKLIQYGALLAPPLDLASLTAFVDKLKMAAALLGESQIDLTKLEAIIAAAETDWWNVPEDAANDLGLLRDRITQLPELSLQDEAKEFLIVANDRYDSYVKASSAAAIASKLADLSAKSKAAYEKSFKNVLEKIYETVQNDFTVYYSFVNRDDESNFKGQLLPSFAKLALNVDFYGRGLFPPGAYHSEGHQDAMGICLYLALANYTFGGGISFAVLDDVMMSVDVGHRREVCQLLQKYFPNTQFILTTHDQVWLQHMKTEGLIAGSLSFSSWTVDMGPRVFNDQDVWQQLAKELENDNVPAAAAVLRRFLEHIAFVLCDALRASPEFHANGQYDLNDLLPPALARARALFDRAIDAARVWGHIDEVATIAAFRDDLKDKIAAANVEQWAINKSVHYTEWNNITALEFGKVSTAFQELLAKLFCSNCKSYIYASPKKGPIETLRCHCGLTTLNLKKKT